MSTDMSSATDISIDCSFGRQDPCETSTNMLHHQSGNQTSLHHDPCSHYIDCQTPHTAPAVPNHRIQQQDFLKCLSLPGTSAARTVNVQRQSVFVFRSCCELPTKHGMFHMRVYTCSHTGKEATVMIAPHTPILKRIRTNEPMECYNHTMDWKNADSSPKSEVSVNEDEPEVGDFDVGSSTTSPCSVESSTSPTNSSGDSKEPSLLLRVQDACFTSELFGSLKCDCAQQLEASLAAVQSSSDGGAVIYLLQEGRGIGLAAKVAAYALQQEQHSDTVDANRALGLPDDVREYGAVRDILTDLAFRARRRSDDVVQTPTNSLTLREFHHLNGCWTGSHDKKGENFITTSNQYPINSFTDSSQEPCIQSLLGTLPIRLLTNNPRKIQQLAALGIKIIYRESLVVEPVSELAAEYLETKERRMGHRFHIQVEPAKAMISSSLSVGNSRFKKHRS